MARSAILALFSLGFSFFAVTSPLRSSGSSAGDLPKTSFLSRDPTASMGYMVNWTDRSSRKVIPPRYKFVEGYTNATTL